MGRSLQFHIVSWESSSRFLYILQRRLFKASYVLDKMKCLELQKLILHSTFARLLAIRETTQLSPSKKIPGIDGRTSLTFLERFELNEYLRDNCTNWNPQVLKILKYVKGKNFVGNLKVPSISDRVWLCLVFRIVRF